MPMNRIKFQLGLSLLEFQRRYGAEDQCRHLPHQGRNHPLYQCVACRKQTSLIAIPSSTKNKEGMRDPEMHQAKKGNQWHFGMKAHIGVDASSGLIHSLVTTPANGHDVTQAGNLLHGEEKWMLFDAGYQGVEKRDENKDRQINWHVAMRPGKRKALLDDEIGRIDEAIEKLKAKARAKVEHPFHILKNRLGMKKTRYRGLKKNTAQLFTLFGIANLLIDKRKLFALDGGGAS